MESPPPGILIFLVVVLAVVVLAVIATKRANEKWKALADRLGATVVPRPGGYRMDLAEKGGETIRIENFPHQEGETYIPVTRLSTDIILPQELRLTLSRAQRGELVAGAARLLGFDGATVAPQLEVPEADPAFAEKYAVRSNRPLMATEVATRVSPYFASIPWGDWEVVQVDGVHRITATMTKRVEEADQLETLLSVFRTFRQELAQAAGADVRERRPTAPLPSETVTLPQIANSFEGPGRTGGFLFGAFFFGISMIFLVMGGLTAVQFTRASLSWVKVPAEVIAVSVKEVDGDEGTSYKPDVRYRYDWKGRTFESSRQGVGMMTSGVSSGRGSARTWVREHPVGSSLTAYVDPSDPTTAALDVRLNYLALLFMLFPVPHVSIGLSIMLASVLGAERVAKLRPILARTALGWGVFGLGLTLMSNSLTWTTGTILFVYLGIAWAVQRGGARAE